MSNRINRHPASSLWAALSLVFCMAPLVAAPLKGAWADEMAEANRIVVHKAEHKLYLYNDSRLLGEYKVQLGLSPIGQKEREHDFRTPEGRYFLARRISGCSGPHA